MNPLSDAFAAGKRLLADNPSVATLADPSVGVLPKLTVLPTMAFWVLAFGDAMALLGRTTGETRAHHQLRQHASEDSEHWRWFLQDLALLAKHGVGPSAAEDVLAIHWGPETRAVREAAWTLHHLLRKHADPVARLAILEACEHGFDAFMSSIRPVVQAWEHYDELAYLGAVHDEAEAGHALHAEEDPFDGVIWEDRDVAAIVRDVQAMYRALDGLHSAYDDAVRAALRSTSR